MGDAGARELGRLSAAISQMLGVLSDFLTRSFRRERSAPASPQRLLALAALRRRIIADVLQVSGREADDAAFALENHLRARLEEGRLSEDERHLIAIGLISRGQVDGFELFEETLAEPAPPITLHALRLLFPLIRRVRKASDPMAAIRWVRANQHRLTWDEERERYS
jgi:hypothetical protein